MVGARRFKKRDGLGDGAALRSTIGSQDRL
jgi:hypothetical protein